MSFCNSKSADRCPGNISGNPLNGLCEKVCMQVRKVFDACITQSTLETLSVTLTDLTPASPSEPLTFVSGKSVSSRGTITALTVTPLADRPGLSRVLANVAIPVQINYTGSGSGTGTGSGNGSGTGAGNGTGGEHGVKTLVNIFAENIARRFDADAGKIFCGIDIV